GRRFRALCRYGVRLSLCLELTTRSVVPAQAGTHIPEAGGYGSPLTRGRQLFELINRTHYRTLPAAPRCCLKNSTVSASARSASGLEQVLPPWRPQPLSAPA